MTHSKNKGKRGELEWAQQLREMGFKDARRGQQFKGTPDSPDVVGGIPFTHAEVKRVERLDLYTAIRKAIDDAGNDAIPYVAHRRNRSEWLVTLRSQDLIPMANAIIEALGLEVTP